MIGRTFGSYQVTAKLGEGGMGAVYLAVHTLLGKKAAVKVLLGEHAQRADLVARFFTEAKAAASLDHPALIEVFDFGTTPDGIAFIVMEFLEGESLGSRLEKLVVLPPEQVVDIARQVASGVGAAHGKGIVHRDLKPDNIYLLPDPDGGTRDRVKILDFGIAKLIGDDGTSRGATSTGMVLGTPLFMAPEQCRGAGTVDLRADIYSLGCILTMMLCGRPPFVYAGIGEILAAHLKEEAPLLRTLNPQVPPALEAVVAKTLAKDPDARYASMVEVSAALAQAINTGASSMPPVARTELLIPAGGTSALPATTLSAAAAEKSRLAGDATEPAHQAAKTGRGKLWAGVGGVVVLVAVAGAFLAGRHVGDEDAEHSRASPGDAPKAKSVSVATVPAVPAPAVPAPAVPPAAMNGGARGTVAAEVTGRASGDGEPTPLDVATGSREKMPREAPPEKKDPPKPKAAKEAVLAFATARTALGAGRDKDALEGFRSYLALTSGASPERMEAQRQVVELQRRFGDVEVVCDVFGATLTVDGRFAGTTPFRRSVILAPGTHLLVVSKPGFRPASRQLSLRPGERQAVVFSLH